MLWNDKMRHRKFSVSAFWKRITTKCETYNVNKSHSRSHLSESEMLDGCRLGLDSHADVTCVGRHARILSVVEGHFSSVYPFNDSYEPLTDIRTVNVAFSTQSSEGETVILHLNNVLDFTHNMEHSLLCTNQARSNGVIVDDVPQEYDHKGDSTHSIVFPDMDLRLPLKVKGPVSYLPVNFPTDDEMSRCRHVNLTSEETWDPDNIPNVSKFTSDIDAQEMVNGCDSDFDLKFLKFNASSLHKKSVSSVTPESLSNTWRISLDDARRTLKATTQTSLRVSDGKLYKRFKTKAHQR